MADLDTALEGLATTCYYLTWDRNRYRFGLTPNLNQILVSRRGAVQAKAIDDRIRQWKLSPMDLPSRERWYDYSRARDMMLAATDTDHAPWHLVRSDDKKRARLNVLSHFLSVIPYKAPKRDKIKLPNRDKQDAYDDEATIKDRRWIEEKF